MRGEPPPPLIPFRRGRFEELPERPRLPHRFAETRLERVPVTTEGLGACMAAVRTFGAVKGKIGEITEITDSGMRITAQGGQIEVAKVKGEETKKISPAEWAKGAGVAPGTILGA